MWLLPSSLSAQLAPALGCSTKPCDSAAHTSTGEPSLRLCVSGKVMPRPLSWPGWKRRAWIHALFSAATLPISTVASGVENWIASLPGSPASRGAKRASRKAPPTNDGCGPNSPESSATRNLRWCSSKTSPGLFQGVDCITFSTALPKCGSMRSGAIAPQKPLALRTSGSECSSWPTAKAHSGGADPIGGGENRGGANLKTAVSQWPSPRGEDSESCGNHPDATDSLTGATKFWGTPRAADSVSAKASQDAKDRGFIALCEQSESWATPASRDYRSPNATSYQDRSEFLPPDQKQTGDESRKCSTRRLNPAFVCWLMGWPWWWTRPEPINFAAAEMESWRSKARSLLLSLCGE